MSASQNNLSLVINQQDSAGVSIINRTIGAITFAGVVGQWTDALLPTAASPVTVTFPTTLLLQFYLKNTSSTANIKVIWTYQGGASQTVMNVGPGGVFLFWNTVTGATTGITAMTLTPDTNATTAEYFIGG